MLAAGGEPNPLIPNLGEVIIGLVAFAVLGYALMKLAFPAFERAYAARTEAIEGGLRRAEETQAEARRVLEEYTRQMAEARTEAATIRDDARADAERITEAMRQHAQEESARIVARGEEQLAGQRQYLVAELRREIGQLSVDLAERIVGDSLSGTVARRKTVDRFLAELDDVSGVGPRANA
ncbi:MAG: F0F1 ATP synthase subunit B [Actinobacteria bacterium]|nr:F0F1 ATP synthase subunit B [Actinomycetota bacterium]